MITPIPITDVQQLLIDKLQTALPRLPVRDGMVFEQLFGQLEHPLITVLLQKMGAEEIAFSDYCGLLPGQADSSEFYAKQCHLVFGIQVFLPLQQEMPAASDLLLAVADALLLDPQGNFSDLTAKPIKFDDRLQAFVVELTVSTFLLLTRGEDLPFIRQVDLRAGHIRT